MQLRNSCFRKKNNSGAAKRIVKQKKRLEQPWNSKSASGTAKITAGRRDGKRTAGRKK